MKRIETDILVIGAGSGGLSVAAGAVQMGARVVLLEGAEMGGDCLNHGCVPSKALIAAAARAHAARRGGMGVAASEPEIDFAAVKDHVADVIAAIAPHDSEARFEGLGVTVIRDWGHFVSENEVQAGDAVIEARRIVIATGSRPFVPPITGLDEVPYLTNETVFAIRDRPDHLIVVGGGPIGIEMAQAHRRLGCEVTVIEAERALPKDDPEAAAVVLERLRSEGVTILEGAAAERVSERDGRIAVETRKGVVEGSHILIAVGRKVALDRLELGRGNVDHDRAVRVDERLRSVSNRRVYAVGDAAGGMQFTHVAGYHAGVVIRQALFGLPARAKTAHVPWVTYSDPELAQVGPTEAEAREAHGDALTVARFDMDGNDRAVASGETEGFAKVMVVGGKPVGATIVGAHAGELIAPWAMAIAGGLKMKAMADTVLPYPTLSEVSKRAAGAYFSPRLFESPIVKGVVRAVQRYLP